jgi:hypothetical protein
MTIASLIFRRAEHNRSIECFRYRGLLGLAYVSRVNKLKNVSKVNNPARVSRIHKQRRWRLPLNLPFVPMPKFPLNLILYRALP